MLTPVFFLVMLIEICFQVKKIQQYYQNYDNKSIIQRPDNRLGPTVLDLKKIENIYIKDHSYLCKATSPRKVIGLLSSDSW